MCGIIGYVGQRPVLEVLLSGLKRLEYRGYDSAGVAFFDSGKLEILKSEGKLDRLRSLVSKNLGSQTSGMGHTRWATHGRPTTQNAHPHRVGSVVLVHNGIIENFLEIREEILRDGGQPQSDTDSELFGFLVERELRGGSSFVEAVRKAFSKLEGSCSVVVMSDDEPGTIVGIRNGSPLVASKGNGKTGGAVIASDTQAIVDFEEFRSNVVYLQSGDGVVASDSGLQFFDLKTGGKIQRESVQVDWTPEQIDKQGYPHYMLKEIFEQPQTLVDTLNANVDRAHADAFRLASQPGVDLLNQAKEITLVACGSSWHAALLGKYWIEHWGGIRVSVELASEYRYRDPAIVDGELVLAISQSGETADTLAVMTELRKRGIPTLSVTNVRQSTITRETDASFYTAAGPEIGVAATKTFCAQLLLLFLIAGHLGWRRRQGNSDQHKERLQEAFQQMIRLPHLMESQLGSEELSQNIKRIAERYSKAKGFFFIGRGYAFPMGLEGALKLKEIAYHHAEGYAAGELKHGPIAMIEKDMVVVTLAPRDGWRDKTLSNLQEVKARGGNILGIGSEDDRTLAEHCDEWIPLPKAANSIDEALLPFLVLPLVQLLSYEIACCLGTHVDQPRNLAKSVTVE